MNVGTSQAWILGATFAVASLASGCRCNRKQVPKRRAVQRGAPARPISVKPTLKPEREDPWRPAVEAPRRPVRPPGWKPPRGDVDPVRANKAVFGFPAPEGLRLVRKSSRAQLYTSPYTLRSLERFFKRETSKSGGKIEKRSLGFKVTLGGGGGFVLVSKRGTNPSVAFIQAPNPRRPPIDSPGH